MPNYKIINTETKGEIHIKENSQYNNLKADRITVAENVSVRLFGTINEVLVIRKGATVYLHGTINGKTENQGGEIFIY